MTSRLLFLATLTLTACGAAAPSASHDGDAQISRDTAALAHRSLGGSSLPQLQLLTTAPGRALFGQVVACALPRGATLTAIDHTGQPHSFSGDAGLAPAWASHPATKAERQRVTSCVLIATSGVARA